MMCPTASMQSGEHNRLSFLVSYPRSGSNFLQSVLEKSSGFRCASIYSGPYASTQQLLSVKSHAISYKHLLCETNRYLPDVSGCSKLILLYRDPRDVMISYYEYMRARTNKDVRQADFLHCGYFLPSQIAIDCLRQAKEDFVSIAQAYREHVANWLVRPLPGLDYIIVRYEDLLQEPEKEFQRVLDFLGMTCSIDLNSFAEKVSQYSTESRPRGQAYGWKRVSTHYRELLKEVNVLLREDIVRLNYEAADAAHR